MPAWWLALVALHLLILAMWLNVALTGQVKKVNFERFKVLPKNYWQFDKVCCPSSVTWIETPNGQDSTDVTDCPSFHIFSVTAFHNLFHVTEHYMVGRGFPFFSSFCVSLKQMYTVLCHCMIYNLFLLKQALQLFQPNSLRILLTAVERWATFNNLAKCTIRNLILL